MLCYLPMPQRIPVTSLPRYKPRYTVGIIKWNQDAKKHLVKSKDFPFPIFLSSKRCVAHLFRCKVELVLPSKENGTCRLEL